eukprot:114478-Chlamydomonas_euryale.AAC.2
MGERKWETWVSWMGEGGCVRQARLWMSSPQSDDVWGPGRPERVTLAMDKSICRCSRPPS